MQLAPSASKTTPSTHRPSSRNPLGSIANWRALWQGHLPGQVVIQYTDQCNASCAQCGMRRENRFERTTLDEASIKKLLDATAARGVQAVSFTGGEPLLYLKPITNAIRYAREIGIRYVRTGTNGFTFRQHDKPDFNDKVAKMAEAFVEAGIYTFWISIDSADTNVHERNRGLPGVMAGVAKALPIFHQHGLYPSANLGINRYMGSTQSPPPLDANADSEMIDAFYQHARHGFQAFYQRVEEIGFTIVNACYPMTFDNDQDHTVYTATSDGDFVAFTPQERLWLFRAMFDVIPEFRHRLRIFTPRAALRALIRHYQGQPDDSYACHGGMDFFFIDAKDMNTYPCGFRGTENLGKFWELDHSKLDQQAWCKQCDWECFRDPSELLGPLTQLFQSPWQLLKRVWHDRDYARLWYDDIAYYRACGYFNAQLPPDYKKLARFTPHRGANTPDLKRTAFDMKSL